MDTAVRYIELMNTFTGTLREEHGKYHDQVTTQTGRRFDRISIDDEVLYFVDKQDWTIYGAKSDAQYNPRRQYGTLETVTQFDWVNGEAKPGTTLAQQITAREAVIAAGYKKRGRPRKTPAVTP